MTVVFSAVKRQFLVHGHSTRGVYKQPKAQCLPEEVLTHILLDLTQRDLLNVIRVCRSWNWASAQLLYHGLYLRSHKSMVLIARTFRSRPALGDIVKILRVSTPQKTATKLWPPNVLWSQKPFSMEGLLAEILHHCTFLKDFTFFSLPNTRVSLNLDRRLLRSTSVGSHLHTLFVSTHDISSNSFLVQGEGHSETMDFPFPNLDTLVLFRVCLGPHHRFPRIPRLRSLQIYSPRFAYTPWDDTDPELSILHDSFPMLQELKLVLIRVTIASSGRLFNGLRILDLEGPVRTELLQEMSHTEFMDNIQSLSIGPQYSTIKGLSLPTLPKNIQSLEVRIILNPSVSTALEEFLISFPSASKECGYLRQLTFSTLPAPDFVPDEAFTDVINKVQTYCKSQGITFAIHEIDTI
ncbi:hypothetical protein NLI96_g8347 [Meripilus lineatus]|uniref:F-box domain-containing protein n=1 Tax=Meripilus lineatus TaxID=2056292 RepID=A0AAD5V243_9APHY|nr:hypothetical protein NLI96_g8347 [Physisporinus lineatus]